MYCISIEVVAELITEVEGLVNNGLQKLQLFSPKPVMHVYQLHTPLKWATSALNYRINKTSFDFQMLTNLIVYHYLDIFYN
jgi:hypothetical protein